MDIAILIMDALWLPIGCSAGFIRENAEVTIGLLAAVGACAGGIGAWRSASRTRLAAEGQLFYERLQEYASKEMRDHLRRLFKWGRDTINEDEAKWDEKARQWIEALFDEENEGHRNAEDIDEARRHVTHYFLNVLQLFESHYVREEFPREICRTQGTRVLDILEPLEKALIKDIGEKDGKGPEELQRDITKLELSFNKLRAWNA